jgi:recombination protein RecA
MEEKKISKESLEKINKAILNPKKKKVNPNSFPTGSDLLDILVGGGESIGYPAGRIANFVGDKSSGKTFLALEVIAAATQKYKNKLKWIYDDCESGFSFDTKRLYGFDIMPTDKKDRIRSRTVEDAYCNLKSFFEDTIKEGEFGIYVIDSLDGLTSKEMDKIADDQYKVFKGKIKDKEKGSYKMGKARYLSDTFFPQLAEVIESKNGLLIVISQVRCNMNPMSFERFARAGGMAMDFYCHTVLWLANINKIKKKDRPVGVTVKVKNNKSKTPRPYREAFLTIYFDYGLDNISTNIDFLFGFRTKTGLLEADAQAPWNNDSVCTVKEIVEFLNENGKEKHYKKNVESKIHREVFMEWIIQDKQSSFFKKYQNKFCKKMSRDELVSYVETNNLQKELTEKVVAKWEAIELSIASNRKPKYP